MHPLIVAAFSLLVCTVYASPIYNDDAIQILKREPQVWNEFEERGIKEFFDNLFHPAPKCHVTKGSIKDSLNHLKNETDGSTSTIKHFDIEGGFDKQPAVLTKYTMPDTGKKGKEAAEKFVKERVKHACQVNQFLNWGVQKGKGKKDGDTFYVVTRKMGVSAKKAGLKDDEISKLQKEALERYHKSYHLDVQNSTSTKYVYRTVNGHWNAEILDTTKGKLDKGAKLPKAPKPQSIS